MTSAAEATDPAAQPEAAADVVQVRRTEAKVLAILSEAMQGTCSAATDLILCLLLSALYSRCRGCFARRTAAQQMLS